MRPDYDPTEETQKVDKTTPFERGLLSLSIGAFVFAVAILAIRGCNAQGQEAPTMLGVEVVYDNPSNQVERTLLKRPAQPMVPPTPLPLPPPIFRSVTTNEQGRRITVRIDDISPSPSALIQDKPRTNAFWVMCPHCSVRAIRTPINIQTNGIVTVADGDQIERTIYFRCCQTEFRARNFKFVETPIAEEVSVPVKP